MASEATDREKDNALDPHSLLFMTFDSISHNRKMSFLFICSEIFSLAGVADE